MHDHLEEGDGGNSNMFEVMRVVFPWIFVSDAGLFVCVISVQSIAVGIDELDAVL